MRVVELAARKPDPDVIASLRELLELAESGALQEFAMVWAGAEGVSRFSRFEDPWRLLGAIEHMRQAVREVP